MNYQSFFKRCGHNSHLPFILGEQAKYNSVLDMVYFPTRTLPDVTFYQAFESFHRLLASTSYKHLTRALAGNIYDTLDDIYQSKGKNWRFFVGDLVFWTRAREALYKAFSEIEEIFATYLTFKFLESDKIDYTLPGKYKTISSFKSSVIKEQLKRIKCQKEKDIVKEIYRILSSNDKATQLNVLIMWASLNLEVCVGDLWGQLRPLLRKSKTKRLSNFANKLRERCFNIIRFENGGLKSYKKLRKTIPEQYWGSLYLHDPEDYFKNRCNSLKMNEIERALIFDAKRSRDHARYSKSRGTFFSIMFHFSFELEEETKPILDDMTKNKDYINLWQVMASLQNTTFLINANESHVIYYKNIAVKNEENYWWKIIGYELIWNDLVDLPGNLENYEEAPQIILDGPKKALKKAGIALVSSPRREQN